MIRNNAHIVHVFKRYRDSLSIERISDRKSRIEGAFHAGAPPSASLKVRRRGSEPIKTSPTEAGPHKRVQKTLTIRILRETNVSLRDLPVADMYRKIRLGFLAIIFLLCLTLDSGAKGQLNFSTGWGKRSHKLGSVESGGFECGPQAKPTLEQMLSIYNLIQTEAQRMLDCRKLNE